MAREKDACGYTWRCRRARDVVVIIVVIVIPPDRHARGKDCTVRLTLPGDLDT